MAAVEVKTSQRHGRGVFARRKFVPGQYVCSFDGYLQAKSKLTPQEQEYCFDYGGDRVLVGYLLPKSSDGVAQLINDVSIPAVASSQNLGWQSLAIAYINYLQLKSDANVIPEKMEGTKIRFIARRIIRPGEELLYFYGLNYWVARCQLLKRCHNKAELLTFHSLYYALATHHHLNIDSLQMLPFLLQIAAGASLEPSLSAATHAIVEPGSNILKLPPPSLAPPVSMPAPQKPSKCRRNSLIALGLALATLGCVFWQG